MGGFHQGAEHTESRGERAEKSEDKEAEEPKETTLCIALLDDPTGRQNLLQNGTKHRALRVAVKSSKF